MAEKRNITADDEFFRGEDKILTVTLDPVVNISGWTLAFTMRLTAGSAEALIEKTTTSGITITDGTHGIFQVTLDDLETAGLQPGKYAYDCKRMDAGAEAILVYGTLELLAEVTR